MLSVYAGMRELFVPISALAGTSGAKKGDRHAIWADRSAVGTSRSLGRDCTALSNRTRTRPSAVQVHYALKRRK